MGRRRGKFECNSNCVSVSLYAPSIFLDWASNWKWSEIVFPNLLPTFLFHCSRALSRIRLSLNLHSLNWHKKPLKYFFFIIDDPSREHSQSWPECCINKRALISSTSLAFFRSHENWKLLFCYFENGYFGGNSFILKKRKIARQFNILGSWAPFFWKNLLCLEIAYLERWRLLKGGRKSFEKRWEFWPISIQQWRVCMHIQWAFASFKQNIYLGWLWLPTCGKAPRRFVPLVALAEMIFLCAF